MITMRDRFFGCFFGAIIGDVLGMPYEFSDSDEFHFDGTMEAGGPFNLKLGYYTDDTSMMIAMADSILQTGKIDAFSQACRYVEWYKRGMYSSTGRCFDIGNQTRLALDYFDEYNEFLPESYSAGNGSLMRVAPAILFSLKVDDSIFNENIKQTCINTHNSKECFAYTTQYASLVRDLILEDATTLEKIKSLVREYDYGDNFTATGYIKTTAYAAIRSFDTTSSFKDCMIDIINIGGDTDTNACIAGMLAGAHYGYSGIQPSWLYNIHNFEYLYNMCERLYDLTFKESELS